MYIRIVFVFAFLFLFASSYSFDFSKEYPKSMDSTEYHSFYKMLDGYIPDTWDNPYSGETLDPIFLEQWISWMMEEEMIPGISLCFLKDGELYWKRHLGVADLEHNIPVSDETGFITGSVSKTIVVTAAMQLYERGLLNLDDDIDDYLPFAVYNPDYPNEPITIRHLMTHVSSIQDNFLILESLLNYGWDSPVELGYFLEEYLEQGGEYYTNTNFAAYPPQEEFNYSNVGVSLLAYLVEEITNSNFEDYCQDNIFIPLGMEDVSFFLANMDTSTLAIPYKPIGDTIEPTPQLGFPYYPAGSFKTTAIELSKFLGMYMKGGTYNQVTILNEETIDTITAFQYPEIMGYEPMGLIWFYKYGFFNHGGGMPGVQAYFGFSHDKRSGMIALGNSNSDDLKYFMEYILINYSDQYDPFSVERFTIYDEDNDNLLESGETAEIVLDVKNIINIHPQANDVKITITTNDEDVQILSSEAMIGDIYYLDTVNNADQPFLIKISDDASHHHSALQLTYSWDESDTYEQIVFFEIIPTEVLLVNDATSFGGMFMQPDFWYWHALDSLGYEMYYYDLSLFGDPSAEFLANFPVVIWFTGYHTSNTLNENNQEALASYLDDGGNLFLTGQDISEDLEGTDFLGDYLHVSHVNGAYQGQDTIEGISGDPIGDGIEIMVNQGFGGMYQFSMSELEPIKGGESVFDYFSTGNSAAVRFENDTYKTVFFGFGFEGINSLTTRLEVMQRILDYFDETVGEEEIVKGLQDFSGPFPNPSQDVARFSYSLQESKNIIISLYDLNGSLLRSETRNHPGKGHYEISLSVSNLPSGVYFYSISAGNSQNSGKLVVME